MCQLNPTEPVSARDSWAIGQDIHLFLTEIGQKLDLYIFSIPHVDQLKLRKIWFEYNKTHTLLIYRQTHYINCVCSCANQKTDYNHSTPHVKRLWKKITYKYRFSFVALFKQQVDGKQGSLYKETYTGRDINPCTYNIRAEFKPASRCTHAALLHMAYGCESR